MTKAQDRSDMRTSPYQVAGSRDLFEEWHAIEGASGYFVSNQGRVCSIDRIVRVNGINRNRNEIKQKGCILRPGINVSGHKYVFMGRKIRKLVHVLVLQAFCGPCPEGHEGLHFDDNPANNSISNLRWGTRSQNLLDAVRNGKKAIGEDIINSKLTDDAVRYIRANSQFSMCSLGQRFGVSAAAVKQVRENITWKHIS